MKKLLLAMLLTSSVYASEELYKCYDKCLNIFRYETNTYPNMPREYLNSLADETKLCCAKCDRIESNRLCHQQCNSTIINRDERLGCHARCDFVVSLEGILK